MAGTLVVTPIHTYVRMSVASAHPSIHMSHQRHLLTKSNSFDQNFMKLLHIIKYHNVLFKFYNGPYHTMPSRLFALCSSKYGVFWLCENMQILPQRGYPCPMDTCLVLITLRKAYCFWLVYHIYCPPGPEGIKLFSCTSQLSIKFHLLIKTKMLKKIGISCFYISYDVIILLTIVGILTFMSRIKNF